MQKWEYQFITHDAKGFNGQQASEDRIKEFNHMGAEGWELVTIIPAAEWSGALVKYLFVFKKQMAN